METTNSQQLEQYSRPLSQLTSKLDSNAPLSFKDWYGSNVGIIPGQEYSQYNLYLLNWYNEKKKTNDSEETQLRINYLTLLRQLQVFFSNEEAENWYNQVNLSDEKELLLAIPYFAQKLRDISLYYLQLRDDIKKTKLKYNLIGTNTGFIQQLRSQLLIGFTKKPNTAITIPSTVWKDVPELSSVKDTFTIQVEELYDDHEYFDQSPTVPVSGYYDLNSPILENYFTTKGITLTSANWMYSTDDAFNESVIVDNINYSQQLIEKYIGEDKLTALLPTVSSGTDYYDVSIDQGNNFLYWPYGAYPTSTAVLQRYEPVPLSASGLETVATAGSSIEIADTIFLKTSEGIQGAWFRDKKYDESNRNMVVAIEPNTKNAFRFPFPGFGLSADDINWTGPGLEYNSEFYYLDDINKKNVEQAYWNFNLQLTSVNSLPVNNTTLLTAGAYANSQYRLADKIKTWNTLPDYFDSTYSGDINEAWLYRFTTTDIPVASAGNSLFVWPYQRLNSEEDYPTYIPSDISTVCQPLPLSAISFAGGTAAQLITGADVIYKVSNYKHTPEQAIECAWLSGGEVTYGTLIGINQPGLNGTFKAGTYTKFIWNGDDNVNVNNVFKTFEHQPDCSYKLKNSDYTESKNCTCNQVLYTPFGHTGIRQTDNNGLADFIVEDNFSPASFSIDGWRDKNGNNYTNSEYFCWYKTSNKIGWGSGTWFTNVSATGNNFYLRKGKAYMYYRANTRQQDQNTTSLPDLVIRYPYGINNTTWIKGVQNTDGTWSSANIPSDMVVRPGDFFIYSKATSSTYSLSADVKTYQAIAENRGSVWSVYDYVSIGKSQFGADQQVIITYPVSNYINSSTLNNTDFYKQYPAVNISNIITVAQWSLRDPSGNTNYYRNTQTLLFTPSLTGVYTTALTAITSKDVSLTNQTASTSGYYFFSNIPPITSVLPELITASLTGNTLPAPGFVINTPLYGWNYNTGQQDPGGLGAKPFWAKSYSSKDAYTNYKAVVSWGTPYKIVDGHNIISQPDISDLTINTGDYFEYERLYPSPFVWTQPVKLKIEVNEKIWSTIDISLSGVSNLQDVVALNTNELVAIPTTEPSNIRLINVFNNAPVEVYYNALSSFGWSVTATPLINYTFYTTPSTSIAYTAKRPWNNLTNRNYPTVASLPAFDELYTEAEKGGYTTPSNLGASVYLNQDYTVSLSTSSSSLTSYFEDSTRRVGGRGLTKQDQQTPYFDIVDDNTWLKEPVTSGPIAGTIKKKVTKKYQKFIPYQSGYETNPRQQVGLVLPTSRQDPWGGSEDSIWTDTSNKPQSFTGQLNVDKWAQTQVLKQSGKQLDSWSTDIFGNQYGLYKNIKNVEVYHRKNIPGEIWTRKNSQYVSPASTSLSAVFDTYKNTSFINELTGVGVRKLDVFFDTLFVETSGVIIFEKIIYDYDTDSISSITDDARYLSLALPVTPSFTREISGFIPTNYEFAKAGETWFFPQEKNVVISVCGLSGNILLPELYNLDINNRNFNKIFPVNVDDINTINSLSSININSIEAPVLSYNELKKEFVIATLCKTNDDKDTIVELTIKYTPNSYLSDVSVYTTATIAYPPYIIPYITQSLTTTVTAGSVFAYSVSALNSPTAYTLDPVVYNWLSVNSSGLFTGVVPTTGIYYVPFKVSNNAGSTSYSLQINSIPALPPAPVVNFIPDIYTSTNITTTFTITATNSPTTYFLDYNVAPAWITVDNNGTFTITPAASAGEYYIPFTVSNTGGSNSYIINVVIGTALWNFDTPITGTVLSNLAVTFSTSAANIIWGDNQTTLVTSGQTVSHTY